MELNWFASKEKHPEEGQTVILMSHTEDNDPDGYNCFLARYENGKYWRDCAFTSRYKDGTVANVVSVKQCIDGVVCWTDAEAVCHTADELLASLNTKIE